MRVSLIVRLIALALFWTATVGNTVYAQTVPTKGEVIKIDESAGKITLRHEPITNLDMDSMTMVFRVKEPAMLKTVAVGDEVIFEADRVNGALTVMSIQKSQ